MKLIIKPSLKYKMSSEEVEKHLHLKRKGAVQLGKGRKFKRKEKHKRCVENE